MNVKKLLFIGVLFVVGVLIIKGFAPLLARGGVRKQTTLVLVGDVMLGRSVNTTSLDKNDPSYPFEEVYQVTKNADIAMGNLESPVVENCPRKTDGMVFCAKPKMVQGLVFAGFDVMNLANNHSLNYGVSGLSETGKYLTEAGILPTGLGRLVVRKVNGTTFGFLGFDKAQQTNPQLTIEEENLIRDSNKKVDVLFVNMHWGIEYQSEPTDGQRKLARRLVELGADVVVGHHPHWVQSWEKIGDSYIFYSLGNFVFDQMWSEKTRTGEIIRLVFDGNRVILEEEIPTYMGKWAQPGLTLPLAKGGVD